MSKSQKPLDETGDLPHLDAAMALATPSWSGVFITGVRTYHLVKTTEGVHVRAELGGLDIELEGPNPSTAVAKLDALIRAILTVINRGRVYTKPKGRTSLQVWSKNVEVLKNLVEVFGGNYYRHGSGLIWICSKRADLVKIREVIEPYVPKVKVERFDKLPKEV